MERFRRLRYEARWTMHYLACSRRVSAGRMRHALRESALSSCGPLVWLPPVLFVSIFTSTRDREGFTDIPYIPVVSQSTWVLASLAIAFLLRGPGLDFAKVWRALGEARKGFGQRFVEAMR
jgi:hypothetical protein